MAVLDDTRRRIGAKAAAAARMSTTFKRRHSRHGVGVYSDDQAAIVRCRRELAKRRSRLDPTSRPSADASPAIRALQHSLDRTSEPALRRRLEQAISHARSLYRPAGDVTKQPDPPLQPQPAATPFRCFGPVTRFCVELLQVVDHVDKHGRRIGLAYSTIRARVVERYPVVPAGRHAGRPTRCPAKELQHLSGRMRASGLKLPHRPRSRSS